MVPVRMSLSLGDGVAVDLLVTPHLAVYEEAAGVPRFVSEGADTLRVMERYADIMYLAAVNAWELDGHGTMEDFPHKRGDFHALMQSDPRVFAKAVRFTATALTGKTDKELAEEGKRSAETAQKRSAGEDGEKVKKKTWLCRIFGRSRRSS